MTVMAAFVKMVLMAMVALVPGGLVLIAAFFLGKAVRHGWQLEAGQSNGFARARKSVTRVRFRDVWREARATF